MRAIIEELKRDKYLLIDKLRSYGAIKKPRQKEKYSCINCSSSDGLSVYEKDGKYNYHCFVCDTTGDVISLLQEKENISFKEAVNVLAGEKGLIIPQSNSRASKPQINSLYKHNTKYNEYKELKEVKEYYINNILVPMQDKLIADKNVDMEEVFKLEEQIKAIKNGTYIFDEIELNQLKKLIKLQDRKHNVINFDKSLIERKEDIRIILELEGLQLVDSPTGSGKTYTFINLFKELSIENRDSIYIILCPNRVQNEQNGKEYSIKTVVGGIQLEEHIQVMSAVYEKLNEIINIHKAKDIVLVVDEAHELIDSISYRNKAVSIIDELSSKCRNIIHLSATTRKLEEYYQYNNIFKFDFNERKNNINTLNLVKSTDTLKDLQLVLNLNKKTNKQSLVFLNGSKGSLKELETVLKAKGYTVGAITSDDKESILYRNIVEDSIIPAEYDVVLATKVLSCGTNIKNENISTIQVVDNINHFDIDNTEQNFARCRAFNGLGYFIYKSSEAKETFKSYDDIKNKMEQIALKNIEAIELLKDTQINLCLEDYMSNLYEQFNSYINALSNGANIYNLDEENYKLSINYKKMINRAFKEYDKQFLADTDMLLELLGKHIKANNIEAIENLEEYLSEVNEALKLNGTDINVNGAKKQITEVKQELKEIKKLTKEAKKELQEKAKETIIKLYKNGYLQEYLFAGDKFELLQMFKKVNETLYKDFRFIEHQEKELDKIKKLFVLEAFRNDVDVLIERYLALKTDSAIDRHIKHILYLQQNTINNEDMSEVYSSYGVIRKHYDQVRKKQGRVTHKSMMSLLEELYKKKLLWQFDKAKMKDLYERYIQEENKDKKNKLLKKLFEATLKELSLIYEFKKDDGKGIRISSLR